MEVVTILKNTSEFQWFLESLEFWRQKKKKQKQAASLHFPVTNTLRQSFQI